MNAKKAKLLRKLCGLYGLPRYCYQSLKVYSKNETRRTLPTYVEIYTIEFMARLKKHAAGKGAAIQYYDLNGNLQHVEAPSES